MPGPRKPRPPDWQAQLNALDQWIQGTFHLRPLLRKVLHLTMKLTGADRGFVIEWRGGEPLVLSGRHRRGLRLPDALMRFSRTIALRAIDRKAPLISHAAAADPDLTGAPSILQLGIRAVACFPFFCQDRPVGALYLDSMAGPLAGVEANRELLEAFARRVGTAAQAARLLEEKEAQLQAASVELERRRESEARLRARARRDGYTKIVAASASMRGVFAWMDAVVGTNVPVIITGETGVGKELIARALHENGPRRHAPFLAINCAAIVETLLESELFGHVAGAFTGARETRAGLFEAADGGTVLLDAVGDLPPPMQAKLLRVLEGGQVLRVGSSQPVSVDVRVLSATNQDLLEKMRAGLFREDLYYRLNAVVIPVPPLRRRPEDIPLLVAHLGERLSRKLQRPFKPIEADAIEALARFPWPGNVRQLEHTLQRLMIMPGARIRERDVRRALRDEPGMDHQTGQTDLDLGKAIAAIERDHLRTALRIARTKAEAARLLGIDRSWLHRLLRTHGMS